MNTEQLLTIVRQITDDEQRLNIQAKLHELTAALTNFAGNPQNPAMQTEVASKLDHLAETLRMLENDHSPVFKGRIEGLGALPYFSLAMARRLRQSMDENPMTPAVVQRESEQLLQERAAFLGSLTNLRDNLTTLGFAEDALEPGEAEIGFQIPRAIFDNELGGFSRELHELHLIIRAFSEAAGNPGERVELRQISTTDPLLFFWLHRHTIRLIGEGIKWCLELWKTSAELRHARSMTANLSAVPAAKSLVEQFDAIIKETVGTRVREEAERISRQSGAEIHRQNEMSNHLAHALEGMFARVERGMTVEIRFLPPPQLSTEEENGNEQAAPDFDELKQLQQHLVFPAASDEPVLKITKQPEDETKETPAD